MARILVTRNAPDAEETAVALRRLGHEPLVAPLRELEVLPLPESTFAPQALLATSRNVFRALGNIPAFWRDLPVHCVGARTAEAARAAGFRRVLAGSGDSAALAGEIARALPAGAHLLYLAGEPRGDVLERDLAQAGFEVAALTCYRMRRVQTLPALARAALEAGSCAAVLHFSSETARAYFDLAAGAGLAREAAIPLHACLSHPIAETVKQLFPACDRVIFASEPRSDSLIALVAAHLAQ
jgi:uroporphyrinogen-III synthase